MDVLEDAIYDFSEVLEFFEEWKSALGASKKEADLETESLERYLFWMTLKRHVGIARKLMIDLYNCFDMYVMEKYRNPFVVKRPGKRNKKLRFGRRQYRIQVETHPYEIFPLFQETAENSFTKKELEVINKLYNGTVKICRLQNFLDDVKHDQPSEEGEKVTVEVMTTTGRLVRGVLTYSPNGSSEKEIDAYLDVTNSCKNMCGVEMHFIGDVEFGLKLIVAKLKRMKTPYVTPIQNVVKLDEVELTAQVRTETEEYTPEILPQVAVDVPPEGVMSEAATVKPPDDGAIEVEKEGGDVPLGPQVVGWENKRFASDPSVDKFGGPFSEHPQPYDDSDSDGSDSQDETPVIQLEQPKRLNTFHIPQQRSRRIMPCNIQ